MDAVPPPDFLAVLEVLGRHGVESLVVGGVGAVLAGAPIVTGDVDILFRRTPENARRLLGALREMQAVYRDPAGRHIEPSVERLLSSRLSLLWTKFGYLDVLAEIGAGRDYEQLLPRSADVELRDLAVRTLDLEAIIETKEESNRPKDLAALPVLRETLALRRARGL
jgi:hypothetical protein